MPSWKGEAELILLSLDRSFGFSSVSEAGALRDADKVVLTAVGHSTMWPRVSVEPRKTNCEASRMRTAQGAN